MSSKLSGAPGRPAEHLEGEEMSSAASCFGKLIRSENDIFSPRRAKSIRGDGPDYSDEVNELVLTWLMEDLDVTSETCRADPVDVFEDLLALIASETPILHRPDSDYAGAVRQLMDWFLEDVYSVACSFDLDPLLVLDDAINLIVSETSLADRIIESEYATIFGEP